MFDSFQLLAVSFLNVNHLVAVGGILLVAAIVFAEVGLLLGFFLPGGVEVKVDSNHAIATVFEPSALAAANDAAGGDAEEVSDVESDNESTVVEGDQAAEDNPGGKKEFESKGE